MKRHLLTLCAAASFVGVSQAQVTNLWNDPAPSGGDMSLASVNVGGAHGDVGEFNSNSDSGVFSSYGVSGQDWSDFAGLDFTFTADIFITSAQLADAAIAEDTIYYEIGGVAGGWLTLSDATWWTADAWNTITWKGTFDSNPTSLTNASALFVNNDMTNNPAGASYQLDNFNLDVEVRDVIWDDQDPVDGNIGLTQIADSFGTGHGNIGEYNSLTTSGQWSNYGSGTQNWSGYAGKKWKMSVDVYITAAQLADATITDDGFYYSVAGASGGWINLANLTPDAWNEIVWIGTLPANPSALASAQALLVINDQTTHPAGPNFYMDNFKLEIEAIPAPETDILWNDPAPVGGNMFLTLVSNAYGTDIGEYDSTLNVEQWENYGIEGQDWSAYAGQAWTFTFDIYATAAQLADANIADDQIYYAVGDASGGWMNISAAATADEWTTITWSGTFTNEPSALTNAFARLTNNDQLTHPAAAPNFYVDNFRFEAVVPVVVEEKDDLWDDQAPAGGDMALAQIADPFGTAHGNMGMFDSNNAGGQQSNYGLSGLDWGAYAGSDWSLSVDVFITAAQLADASINDDTITCIVGGATGSAKSVATLVADQWNTLKWTGTFPVDAGDLANTGSVLVNDDMGTHPVSGVNYFVDNFLLQSVDSYGTPPPVFADAADHIEFIGAEGFSDGNVSGQQGWINQASGNGNWEVDTASGGSVTTTNLQGCNMTLLQSMPLIAGQTIDFTVKVKYLGTHGGTAWTYPGRLGFTTSATGANVGYDAAGNSLNRAVYTFQGHNTIPGQFRLFGDGWGGPSSAFIDSSPGDEWALGFSITLGADAVSTTFSTTITNLNTGMGSSGGTEDDGVGAELYNALMSGTAYPFFEASQEPSAAPLYDGNTGMEILSFEIMYPVETSDSFRIWATQQGLSGPNSEEDADPDQDGRDNLAEYMFGGDPHGGTGANDQGILPKLDGFTYKYSLMGDPLLVANVLTNVDLANGSWGVADTLNVTADDGAMSEYNFDTGGSAGEVFIKLEVIRN